MDFKSILMFFYEREFAQFIFRVAPSVLGASILRRDHKCFLRHCHRQLSNYDMARVKSDTDKLMNYNSYNGSQDYKK